MLRTAASRIISAASLLAVCHALAPTASAQSKVLDNCSYTLTDFQMAAFTPTQSVRPLAAQRGVNIDGALRHPGLFGTTFWANPFGEGWDGQQRLGDVRLDTGTYNPTEVDLALPSGGPTWVIGRTYNSVQRNSTNTGYYNNNGFQGVNWFQSSQPELVLTMGGSYLEDTIYIVYGADRYIEFQRTGEGSNYYKAKNGAAGIIRHDAYVGSETPTPPGTYTYFDQAGNQTVFFDGDYSDVTVSGQLWKITDANSKVAYVGDPSSVTAAIANGYDAYGHIAKAYDSAERRYTYTYSGFGVQLVSVVAETKTGATWASPGTVTEVGRVEYSYYTSTVTDQGMSGDLKLVTITIPLTSGSLVKNQYYRYYTGTYNSSTNPGSPHQIKLVLGYEGARNFDWGDNGAIDTSYDSTSVSAATLKSYASVYLEYYDTSTASENGKKRIHNAMFNGECGCSGGTGNGTYTFSYEANGSFSNTSGYDTAWKSRVTLTRPDSTYEMKYFDEVGQPLSKVVLSAAPGASPASWPNYVARDSGGRVTDIATPAASSYNDSTRAIAESGSTGLVNVIERCDSTLSAFTGKSDLDGLPVGQQYRQAGSSTKYYTSSIDPDAFSVTLSGSIVLVRPVTAGLSVYPTATSTRTDSTRNYTTYTNTPYASTIMYKQVDTTLPVVSTGNNGSNSANTRSEYFTLDGRRQFAKNEEGIIAYSAYDAATGLQTVSIQDTNTSSGDLTGVTIPSGFATSGTALHYKTGYAYDPQGRLSSTTMTDGTVAPMCYLKLNDGRTVSLGSPKTTGSLWYGPATCTITNQANKPVAQCTIDFTGNTTSTAMSSWITSSATNPVAAVATGAIARMTFNTYDNAGIKVLESDRYFLIPSSWPGTSSSNFDPSTFAYDAMGRRWRTKTPAGDITRLVYDTLGRTTERWLGTNDHSFTDGESSGTDNMTKVEVLAYDGGSAGGNSNLTSRTQDEDGNWATTTDQRVTSFAYDYRNRQILTTNALAPHSVAKYDNLGRTVAVAQFDASSGLSASTDPTSTASTGGTKRTALSESMYDEMGRVWKSIRHKVTQSTGADADHIDTLNWFDPVGRSIKTNGEMLSKTRYDRLGRAVKQYTLSKDNDSGYSNVYSSGQTDISGDTVVEQVETVYDNDSSYKTGLPILKVAISRHWNESTGTTGDLDSNGDGDPLTVTATNINGRLQISSSWYDDVNRLKATVNIGSYGIVGDGATTATAYARGTNPRGTVPTRSDTVLVTSYAYDYSSNPGYNSSAVPGEYTDVTDPLGLVTRTVTDAAGRKVCTIANLSSPTVPISTMNRDANVFTRFAYAAGNMTQMMVDLNGNGSVDITGTDSTTDQVTAYFYGTTKTASYSPSKLCSGGLLRAIKYPDSASSATSAAGVDANDSGVVAYAYNAIGQKITESDPAGNVLSYAYDLLGREIARGATATSGFDGDVQEIDTAYLSRGLVNTVTQKGASAVVKDQLQYSYDDWGNLTKFEQDPDGVIGAGGQSAFSVQYAYAKAGSSTTRNTIRRSGMTMPDGTSLTYTYATGMNADLSRVSAINNGTIDLAQYNYMGLGSVVYTIMPGPQAWTSALESAYDKTYPYWDRFNRPTHNQWEKTYSNPAPKFYNVDIAYDRNSNITSVVDNVQKTDTPPNSGINSFDALYSMDGLNRLIEVNEGNKSGSSIGTQSRGEMWKDASSNLQLSQTGNWDTYRLATSGTTYANDVRSHDTANKLTSCNSSAITSYANGSISNLGGNFGSYQFVYDAFNRLRFIKDKSGALLQEYRYNGLGYRIAWHYDVTDSVGKDPDGTVNSSDPWYFFCYDESWRMVATFISGYDSPKEQFYNHTAGLGGYGKSSYIDSVIMRDRDMTAGWIGAVDGTLEERSWYCQNWRADVSAVLDATGGMREWIKYSAYGVPLGIPAGDVNSDGVVDKTDETRVSALVTTAFGASNYDVRADRNLDGTINSTDDTQVAALDGTLMGRGALSRTDTANRKGYTGSEGAGGSIDVCWHQRHRMLDSATGRWLQRDPLGYIDSASLYSYVIANPLGHSDPLGLALGVDDLCVIVIGTVITVVVGCLVMELQRNYCSPPGRMASFPVQQSCSARCESIVSSSPGSGDVRGLQCYRTWTAYGNEIVNRTQKCSAGGFWQTIGSDVLVTPCDATCGAAPASAPIYCRYTNPPSRKPGDIVPGIGPGRFWE